MSEKFSLSEMIAPGRQHLLLVLLSRGCCTLTPHQGLLPFIISGHQSAVGLGDLDEYPTTLLYLILGGNPGPLLLGACRAAIQSRLSLERARSASSPCPTVPDHPALAVRRGLVKTAEVTRATSSEKWRTARDLQKLRLGRADTAQRMHAFQGKAQGDQIAALPRPPASGREPRRSLTPGKGLTDMAERRERKGIP
jgi:hypothetical protein